MHDSEPCRWWAPLLIATVSCAHSPDGIRGKHLTGNRVGGLRSTVYGLADSLPAAPHIEDSLRLRHVPTRREC